MRTRGDTCRAVNEGRPHEGGTVPWDVDGQQLMVFAGQESKGPGNKMYVIVQWQQDEAQGPYMRRIRAIIATLQRIHNNVVFTECTSSDDDRTPAMHSARKVLQAAEVEARRARVSEANEA
jgi:hypothetical protein